MRHFDSAIQGRRTFSRFSLVFTASAMGLVLAAVPVSQGNAENLVTEIRSLLSTHERVDAARDEVTAAKEGITVAYGDWMPEFEATGSVGYEKQNKSFASNTSAPPREMDLSLTQKIWDFGKINADIAIARIEESRARTTLIQTEQSVAFEGIDAYLSLIQAKKVLDFAQNSEDNIKAQTRMESTLVESGRGYSTDVLQAKTQLAGAQARRARAEGAMVEAMNRYRALYKKAPSDVGALEAVRGGFELLPSSVDEAIKVAAGKNPELKIPEYAYRLALQSIDRTKADEFFPSLDASLSQKFKEDVGGTVGTKDEFLAKVEMSWPITVGPSGLSAVKAARSNYSAVRKRYDNALRLTEEETRNAWRALKTAGDTAGFLNNQARIAAQFLELAREERRLGKRSLLDVLAGETALINALSDAAAADTQVLVASFRLLRSMGTLTMDNIEAFAK